MNDEMFFSRDDRALIRGKRSAPRTETCRPCLIQLLNGSGETLEGVALDVTPFGMLVRMLGTVPPDTPVAVQLMRDENFTEPMAGPRQGIIVRTESADDGFADHGIQLRIQTIRRPQQRPPRTGPAARHDTPRPQSVDSVIGGTGGVRGRS